MRRPGRRTAICVLQWLPQSVDASIAARPTKLKTGERTLWPSGRTHLDMMWGVRTSRGVVRRSERPCRTWQVFCRALVIVSSTVPWRRRRAGVKGTQEGTA